MNIRRLIIVSLLLLAVLAVVGPPARSASLDPALPRASRWHGTSGEPGRAVLAGLLAQGVRLSPSGEAYELNLDSKGTLWVSDPDAGEIRSFDPTSGAYTAYLVGGGPSDARSDGAGSVWWADFDSNRLGRLSTSTRQTTIWEIPDSLSLYTTAIDSSGDVWVSDYVDSFIYRLDPRTNQLCTYELPDYGASEYLYSSGQQLWFADVINARIVRLQDDTFDWWNLPEDSYPWDLELDGSGDLWWADFYFGYLGRLNSATATITTFTPPVIGTPLMLTLSGGKVWTSQQDPSGVVVLDPVVATSEAAAVTTGSQKARLTCRELLPLAPTPVTTIGFQASWTWQSYRTAVDEAGWTIYQMPADSFPYGIAAADKIWLVDQGRRVLARLTPSTEVYLPLVVRP